MPAKRAPKSAPTASRSKPRRVVAAVALQDQRELVIITGMSGAGKASALKAFEDLGYYAVDNLPVGLIENFAELVRDTLEIDRAALVVDIREGSRLDKLPEVLRSHSTLAAHYRAVSRSQGRRAGAPL